MEKKAQHQCWKSPSRRGKRRGSQDWLGQFQQTKCQSVHLSLTRWSYNCGEAPLVVIVTISDLVPGSGKAPPRLWWPRRHVQGERAPVYRLEESRPLGTLWALWRGELRAPKVEASLDLQNWRRDPEMYQLVATSISSGAQHPAGHSSFRTVLWTITPFCF